MDTPQLPSPQQQLQQYADWSSRKVAVSQPGQNIQGLSVIGALGSLGYYLADFTEYFVTGPSPSEIPLYLAFVALSGVAVSNLTNICGRKDVKTQVKGALSGAGSGLGVGGTIAGIALGLAADIATMGLTTITGAVIGYFSTRRGRKVHPRCKQKLPCDTWICVKCKHIIAPSREWTTKDRWNYLDVADYLDTGGLEMDTLQALAFMEEAKIFDDALALPGMPPTWEPAKIRATATDIPFVRTFGEKWGKFKALTHPDTRPHTTQEIEGLFRLWKEFGTESEIKRSDVLEKRLDN